MQFQPFEESIEKTIEKFFAYYSLDKELFKDGSGLLNKKIFFPGLHNKKEFGGLIHHGLEHTTTTKTIELKPQQIITLQEQYGIKSAINPETGSEKPVGVFRRTVLMHPGIEQQFSIQLLRHFDQKNSNYHFNNLIKTTYQAMQSIKQLTNPKTTYKYTHVFLKNDFFESVTTNNADQLTVEDMYPLEKKGYYLENKNIRNYLEKNN
ncbi:MAG: hypothetical protein ACQESC_03975 [Nanobdellota archaeon]